MKRYVKSSSSEMLSNHFNQDDRCYLRLLYDVYRKHTDGKYYREYQERTEYMPVYDALYSYGDWNYLSAYTTGFKKSPDGDENWHTIDVWISSYDHPEMTHMDEAIKHDMLGPVGKHMRIT